MAKKIFILAMGLLMVASVAMADKESEAISHVKLNVVSNIAVSPIDSYVELGDFQKGDAGLPIKFRIDANTEQVIFEVEVTDLYKGNDPSEPDVDPIQVSGDVVIDAEDANPVGSDDDVLAYIGTGYPISALGESFPTMLTEDVTYESSQDGHFSQWITVEPTWTITDPEQPQGEYSGFVRLTAMTGLI